MFMEGTNMMGQLFFIEVVVPRKSLTALIDDPSKSLPPPLNASYIFSFIWWAFFLNSFPFSLFLNTSLITLQPPPLISTPIGHGFDPQFMQKISVVCACIFLSSIQKISSCLIVAESTPRATSIQTPTSLSSFWELKALLFSQWPAYDWYPFDSNFQVLSSNHNGWGMHLWICGIKFPVEGPNYVLRDLGFFFLVLQSHQATQLWTLPLDWNQMVV